MNLYRMIFVRDGKPRGITFAHQSGETAARFAGRFCDSLQRFYPDCKLLTVIPAVKRSGRTPEDIARQHVLIDAIHGNR